MAGTQQTGRSSHPISTACPWTSTFLPARPSLCGIQGLLLAQVLLLPGKRGRHGFLPDSAKWQSKTISNSFRPGTNRPSSILSTMH